MAHLGSRVIIVVALCLLANRSANAIDQFDTGLALADVVRRSLMVDLLSTDPFTSPAYAEPRKYADINDPLCTAATIKQGLRDGSCWPSKVKLCGDSCVSLAMDPGVYRISARQIDADLRAPCDIVSNLRLPPGFRDNHPSYFYFSKRRLMFFLGCLTTPMNVLEAEFKDSVLTIRYEGS